MIKHDIVLPWIDNWDMGRMKRYSNIWRDGGIRLQREMINNKQIFHNYGQGLAQFSLSYGCSHIACKMLSLKSQLGKIKEVAVIGSGITALMTALYLVKKGCTVNLYLDRMPTMTAKGIKYEGEGDGLQFWYCGDYDNNDPLKHELISKLSFDFFRDAVKLNMYQSLSLVNVYLNKSKLDQLKQHVTDFITNQIQQVNVNFNNSSLQQYICYKTIMIDTQLFMQQIFIQLKLRNINVKQQKFTTINDILNLKEQYVFNCLKMENRQIFGDSKIKQIYNYCLTYPKPQTPATQNIVIWQTIQKDDKQNVVINISNKKIQVNTRNIYIDKLMLQEKQYLLYVQKIVYQFLKCRTIKPSKL